MLVDINIIMMILINNLHTKCPCKPCGNSLYSSHSLLVKRFEEEIKSFKNCVDTTRG